ncbi:MAG TPA: dihydrolipoamide acetyltransferase family protein [Nitrososphaerales archaeon]|nr:dihydrolipoamide acetyltransferase family protein [Nitrososphaerales archaeon]
MPREFKLPDLGEGVAEGEIVKWLVTEGDEIKEDQPMVEVMTDKATVQIPSPTSGRVGKILAKEGQTVRVGTSIVSFDAGGEQQTGVQAQPQQQREVAAVPSQPAPPSAQMAPEAGQKISHIEAARVVATPATRKLARELGVDIESVRGTGPGGRTTEEDVRKAAESSKGRGKEAAQAVPQLQQQQVVQRQPSTGEVVTEFRRPTTEAEAAFTEREEHIPLHGIRKRIAEKMAKSVHTAAHVTHVDEVDFTELIALREKLKRKSEEHGVKLTFLPFLMKAAVAALKEYPNFNASIDIEKEEIVVKHYYNMGFATDTPSGLIVPVVKDVDQKSILQIAKEIEELSARAREGKISLDDIQHGTFTITNIGTLGGMISTPIINFPEVAILGVHKIQKKPVVREENIVIRDVAFLALSFDHRIVDGADAARFTSKIISVLESPGLMILDSVKFY